MNTFHLTVDYTQTLAAMIAAGRYAHVDERITEQNFPVGNGPAEVNAALLAIGNWTRSSDKIVTNIGQRGFRPATMTELLAFGAKHGHRRRAVALGTIWVDPNFEPSQRLLDRMLMTGEARNDPRYVGEITGRNHLNLVRFAREWPYDGDTGETLDLFLAVLR